MVRVQLISLTYFSTLYLLTSVFPVNTILHPGPRIVFRYLSLCVMTFFALKDLFKNSRNPN